MHKNIIIKFLFLSSIFFFHICSLEANDISKIHLKNWGISLMGLWGKYKNIQKYRDQDNKFYLKNAYVANNDQRINNLFKFDKLQHIENFNKFYKNPSSITNTIYLTELSHLFIGIGINHRLYVKKKFFLYNSLSWSKGLIFKSQLSYPFYLKNNLFEIAIGINLVNPYQYINIKQSIQYDINEQKIIKLYQMNKADFDYKFFKGLEINFRWNFDILPSEYIFKYKFLSLNISISYDIFIKDFIFGINLEIIEKYKKKKFINLKNNHLVENNSNNSVDNLISKQNDITIGQNKQ